MKTITFELTYEQVDQIVTDQLVEYHQMAAREANAVKALPDTTPARLEDYKYNKKLCKALKRVIRYCTTDAQFKALNLEEVK